MNKFINIAACLVAAALLCVASVSPSHATATTVYVSGGGSDANACTLSAPCQSIGRALIVGGSGSTISCLDTGPYVESFASSVSFTLDCRGVVYVTPNGSIYAITVNTSAPVVTIRHVIFDGSAGGGGAVRINGGKVVLEDCTFQNFTAASPRVAIYFIPSIAGAQLTVTDSVVTNNGLAGSGGGGIIINPEGGVATDAVIERTQLMGNTYGIAAVGLGGTALVEIRDSAVANSVFDGIQAFTTTSVASVVVEHSASVQNGGNGIFAQGANAYVSLNDSTVAWNATGLNTASGGTILSYKDNLIAGNPIAGVTPVGLSQQ